MPVCASKYVTLESLQDAARRVTYVMRMTINEIATAKTASQ